MSDSLLDLEQYKSFPVGYPASFVAFHEANGWIYDSIVREARALKDRGYSCVGMRYLFEHQRYQTARPPFQSVDFVAALNNNFSAYYARLVTVRERDLVGFFRMRRMRGEMDSADASQQSMEFD